MAALDKSKIVIRPNLSRVNGFGLFLWPFVVVLSMLLGAFLVSRSLESYERVEIQKLMAEQLNRVKGEVSDHLVHRVEALEDVAGNWKKRRGMSQDEWDIAAGNLVKHYQEFQVVGWVDSQGVVRLVVPFAGNEAALNLDLHAEERRRLALEEAQQTRKTTISSSLFLIQGERGFFVFVPVYQEDVLEGFVMSVLRYRVLFDRILRNVIGGYAVDIFHNSEKVYSSQAGGEAVDARQAQGATFDIGGAQWHIHMIRIPGASGELHSDVPGFVLIFGIIVSLLLGILVYYIQARLPKEGVVEKIPLEGKARLEKKDDGVFRRMSWICAWIVVGITLVALGGWISGHLVFASIKQKYVPMAPSTIFCFLALCGAFFVEFRQNGVGSFVRKFIQGGVWLAAFFCAVIIFDFFAGNRIFVDIESIFLRAPWQAGSFLVGRMSPLTAASFLFVSLAILFLKTQKTLAAFFATSVFFIGAFVFVGYWYRVPLLYGWNVIPVAFLTALNFLFLGLGLVCAIGPDYWPLASFTGTSVRAKLVRNFLPLTLGAILFYGWVYSVVFSQIVNPAVVAVLVVILFSIIVGVVASRIAIVIGGQIDRNEISLARSIRALKMISECNEALIHANSEEELLRLVCRSIVSTGQYVMAWVGYFRHDDIKSIEPIVWAGTESGYLKDARFTWADTERGRDPTGKAARTGKFSRCDDMQTDPDFAPWQQEAQKRGYVSSVAFPLVREGRVFGVISVYAGVPRGIADIEELKLLEELSSDLSHGIYTFRLREEKKRTEEALRYSEETYRRLFEAAKDGILIIDAETGYIQDVNPFLANLLGCVPGDLWGKELWEIGVFEDIAKSKASFEDLRDKGYVRYEDVPLRKKDGSRMDVEFVSNVYDVGRRKVVQCNIRDITDRKQAKKVLQESESRFRSLFESMNSGVAVYEIKGDGQDIVIKDFNSAAEKIENISRADILGRLLLDVFPGAAEIGIVDSIRRVWQTGKSEYIPTVFYKDQRIHGWRENYLYKLPSGEVVAIYEDVTERKKDEEEIRILAKFPAEDPNPVFRIREDGQVLYYNPVAESLLGVLGLPVSRENIYQILPPNILAAIKDSLREGLPFFESEVVVGDQVFAYSVAPVAEGQYANLYGMNITSLKRAEEALREVMGDLEQRVEDRTKELTLANEALKRANQVKSEFLASMSHELRTPLNSIIGFSEILYDETFGQLNAKQKEYLNDVLECGRHLLSLINDILDLSKIEAGRLGLAVSSFSFGALLQDCGVLFGEKVARQSVVMESDIPKDIGDIKADARKIRQVLYNLLSNAIKFTPSGGKVGIRAKKTANEIEVAVWDTGIGIAGEYKEKIFEEFFQIENVYTKTYQGTGLGLTLAKKLVELHGGKIWVESEGLGKGATFKFTIPLRS